jgi:pimeloyl-ACP methyl ester carboxylesterase/DNA-binding SARP family transcriptional activator
MAPSPIAATIALHCRTYPTLSRDGVAVPLKLKRGLALLVLHSEFARKVSRQQLADLLWPDAAADVGRARLRRLCHQVNSVLGVDLIVGDADALWFAPGHVVESDVARVRRCAQQLIASSIDAPSRAAIDVLLEPNAHGVMAGFALDADSFESWLDQHRSEQQRLVLRALHRAAEHLGANGQPLVAAVAAERMIALDPLADAGHQCLMQARAQLGDAAAVEAAYFACAEVLRRELGVRPSAQIEAAYERARAQLASALQPGASRPSALPPIRFAETSDGAVAYLELGAGETTIAVLFGLWSHLEVAWEEPRIRAVLDRLAQRCRVVLIDRRGTGLSERLAVQQLTRSGVEDLDAVRRALGVDRLWLFGNSVGGMIAIDYAAAHGAHVEGLLLYAVGARGTAAPDYPWAATAQQLDKWLAAMHSGWGGPVALEQYAPSCADDIDVQQSWARMMRQSASKHSMPLLLKAFSRMDVRPRLPLIKAPTLVVQREGDRIVRAGAARELASRIAGARLVMLPGDDNLMWLGDTAAVIDEVERFIAQTPRASS